MTRIERVAREVDLPAALDRLALTRGRRVIVVVGSAGGLSATNAAAITPLIDHVIIPLCEELDVTLVDGGTDSGVMRLVGTAHARAHASFPLVGVVAAGTVAGTEATVAKPADLEANHTSCVLVPGVGWGDESPWIPKVATALARGASIAGVLLGGGEISRLDVRHLIESAVPVFAIRGSGQLADALGKPSSGDAVVDLLRRSDLVIPLGAVQDPGSLDVALRGALVAAR
jgi:SLOG in TRPM, prokaryote